LDFEKCDPEVFDAVVDILNEQAREAERERLARDLRGRMG